ncbi:hypothetical protein GUJ93_ZPchr0001g31434 [Zizania palustris]|uniref:Transcription repressor n=1 Tax=Zizania palustris TaxID=103762 RepID=A0A8J5V617_ZIZPA|nr:hypothetical protein GUJ93_ZPchr0001g31434 [Zizania palustris]
MGRRKFRLSDLMPNAWLYKLRDMRARGGRGGGMRPPLSSSSSSLLRGSGTAQQAGSPTLGSSSHRASYYYTTRDRELWPRPAQAPAPSPPRPRAMDTGFVPLTQPPTRSYRRRHRVGLGRVGPTDGGGLVLAPPDHNGCRHRVRGEDCLVDASGTSQRRRDLFIGNYGGRGREFRRSKVAFPEEGAVDVKVITSDAHIIIDPGADDTTERLLRPIVTRPARRELDCCEPEVNHVDLAVLMTPRASPSSEHSSTRDPRRLSVSSRRRQKTRTNSPRIVTSRKGRPTAPAPPTRNTKRHSTTPPVANSFAVVKSSSDPRRDFLESMEEIIAENGIRDAGDLEDLLACYLYLNSAEYHDLIVEVFEQVWTGLAAVTP